MRIRGSFGRPRSKGALALLRCLVSDSLSFCWVCGSFLFWRCLPPGAPAAPWYDSFSHSRRFSFVRAPTVCLVTSAWCCSFVVSLVRPRKGFGASPLSLVPGLRSEVRSPAWSQDLQPCGARRCHLFPTRLLGLGHSGALSSPITFLFGHLCSRTLLFPSPSALAGVLARFHRRCLVWPGFDLAPGLCTAVCSSGLAAVLSCTPGCAGRVLGSCFLVLPRLFPPFAPFTGPVG